jgi:aspartate ammonia-lyase
MNNGFHAFTDYCLTGIEANEERLKEYVEKSVGNQKIQINPRNTF